MKPTFSQKFAALSLGVMCGLGLGNLAGCATEKAYAAPCAKHAGQAKAKCQDQRAKLRFPQNPTMQEMKARVPDWRLFICIGQHEQPGAGPYGIRFDHQGPTWGGGLGIYRQTWYAAGSPYRLWSGDVAQTILVADAVRDRFGISAWDSYRACV